MSLHWICTLEIISFPDYVMIIAEQMFWQGVTLGGTGKEVGDRHPKVGEGALISASATILGNIKIGKGAMVAAGSLVLKDVPPHR